MIRVIQTHAAAPLRLFLALWPDPALRARLAALQQAWTWPPRAAQVRADRLHLTLHFLGDVAAPRLSELVHGLRVPFEPFEMRFGCPEVWPGGIAVLSARETPPALSRLHAALGTALRALALPVEARPFRPHVTLARRAGGAQPPGMGPDFPWRAQAGYVLVRSLPGDAGYEPLARFV